MSSEVQRYITGIMTPVEMANPGPASISARQTVVVTYEDYAALEAENARLVREAKNDAIAYRAALERQDELRAERDAAIAQLAAIQGGMGGVVEVAATYCADMMRAVPSGLTHLRDKEQLVTLAQHQRITAAMAAEVEQVRAELEAIKGQEPALWFRSLIGAQCKPDGRCYDVVFSPCEGFIPLYALPPDTQQGQPK